MQKATKISDNGINLELIYYKKDASPISIRSDAISRVQIEREVTTLTADLDKWRAINPQAYVDAQIANFQAQKDKWDKMKQAIDGTINDSVVVVDD